MIDIPEHSPLPWKVFGILAGQAGYREDAEIVVDAGGHSVAVDTTEIDAAHIVKCVNEAPELHKRIAELEAKLAAIDELITFEINPANYGHDEVSEMNAIMCQVSQLSEVG